MKKPSKRIFIFFLMMLFGAQSIKPAEQSKREQLVDAILKDDLEGIKKIFEKPPLGSFKKSKKKGNDFINDFINEQDQNGNTPLSIACKHFYATEMLRGTKSEHTAIPDYTDERRPIIEYLLDNGAQDSLTIQNNKGETPLIIIATIAKGISPRAGNENYVYRKINSDELASLLLSYPKGLESINMTDNTSRSAFLWAWEQEDEKLMNLLVKKGTSQKSLNALNRLNEYPLLWALKKETIAYDKKRYQDLAQNLIEKGALIQGTAAGLLLNNAYQTLDVAKIKDLIAKKADPHRLCTYNNLNNSFRCKSFLNELLEREKILKARTLEGAQNYNKGIAMQKDIKTLGLIQEIYAVIWEKRNVRDKYNNNALHYASQCHNQDLVRRLLGINQAE